MKNKKKWYLRWWAFVIYIFVFIFFLGSSSTPEPTAIDFVNTSVPKETTTNNPQPLVVDSGQPKDSVKPTPVAPEPISVPTPELSNSDLWLVAKVIDGDTITVEKDGTSETLRLIGLNTPETVDPRKPVECFGKEASSKAKSLLEGQYVRLEADSSQGERDKYARLLRYVLLPSGTIFNKLMIQEGYAYEYTYDKPYKYQTEFKLAEQQARVAKKGLWADDVCEEVSTPQPPEEETGTITAPTSQGNWVCNKNTYNCDDFKTHDEAQDAFESCGGSSNDIHKLDQDNDGVVCESLP